MLIINHNELLITIYYHVQHSCHSTLNEHNTNNNIVYNNILFVFQLLLIINIKYIYIIVIINNKSIILSFFRKHPYIYINIPPYHLQLTILNVFRLYRR
jgi:hypothetical protein